MSAETAFDPQQGPPGRVQVVVALPARADRLGLSALRRQLRVALHGPGELVVDGSRVQELSLGAQALLVAARRTARRRGLAWRLDQPTPALLAALRASGLSHLLVPVATPPTRPPLPAGPQGRARRAGPSGTVPRIQVLPSAVTPLAVPTPTQGTIR